MTWTKWHTLVWVFWLVFFLGYELWSLLDLDSRTPALTQATVCYVPWYVTLSFIGWLFYHFAVRYFNSAYVAHLKVLSK
jgi:membrane-bound acyltransferase YfiQ involved in biofilm formation